MGSLLIPIINRFLSDRRRGNNLDRIIENEIRPGKRQLILDLKNKVF